MKLAKTLARVISKSKERLAVSAVALSVIGLGATSTQANNLFGIDVSSFQGTVNWSSVYANGARFAFAKATEGTYYHDAYYNSNMPNGKNAGLKMGAYHFTRCDVNCASTEANYFWSFAGSRITADGKSIFPVIDFETYNGHACQSSYTDWMNAWSGYVKGKTSASMHPILYSSAGAGMCYVSTACTLEAWVANYNGESLYTGDPWSCCTSCNFKSPGTHYWVWWQVSSSGSIGGVSGSCDFDAYFSTVSHMASNDLVGD
jgi:lysozyme